MADNTNWIQGDNEATTLRKILTRLNDGISTSGGGGGGGGGGAVTVADGADVAQGATGDARATNATSSWSVVALLKGIFNNTSGGGGGGAVTVADGADVTQGEKADAANTDSTSAWSVVSLLKGIWAKLAGTLVTSNTNIDVALSTRLKPADTLAAVTSITNTVTVAGNVGSFTTVIKDTTAVTAAAYSAGNAVGGKRTLANAVRVSGGTGILQSVTLLDRANQKAAMTLFIFDADPSAATLTDKTAFVFSTDDLKVVAQVPINAGDYVTTNSKAFVTYGGLGIPVKAASGTTLYAALVTSGTPTFAATTDVQLEVGILQD